MTKQKNFNLIIDAINLDPKLYKGLKIFIFGEGELRSDLEKKIKINNLENKIFIRGYVKDIYKYFKKVDFYSYISVGGSRFCNN